MSETLVPRRPERPDYTRSLLTAAATLVAVMVAGCASAPTPAPSEAPPPRATETAPPARPAMQPEDTAPRSFTPAPRAPATYTVVKGDTLWDISARFLSDPWKWPSIWKVNPQIQNPDLIYPGDVITLTYDANGNPVLTASRDGQPFMTTSYTTRIGGGDESGQVVKVRPRIRTESLDQAIPVVRGDAVRPFLSRSIALSEDQLTSAPYVFRSEDGRLMSGSGDRVYVRNLNDRSSARYTIVRKGDAYTDPDTGKVLGYEGLFVGEAIVQQFGDPGIVEVVDAKREVLSGDHLVSGVAQGAIDSLTPRAAHTSTPGRIIHVVDGVAQIGQYAVVVINKGSFDNVQPGDVFAVMQVKGTAADKVAGGTFGSEKVALPDQRAGELMVFRAFDRVSYALVMSALSEIHVGDEIRSP